MIPHYPHQIEGLAFCKANKKALLAWHMRLGKSRTALEAADPSQRILIVCPVVVLIAWQRQIQLWLKEDSIQVVKKYTTLINLKFRIHIVPYSIINAIMVQGGLSRPEHFILDESHYCKDYKNKRTSASMYLLRDAETAVILSGTPVPNRPVELLPIFLALHIFKNIYHYEKTYCSGWMAPWGWDTRGASHLPELAEHLKDFMHVVGKDRVEGMPELLPPKVIELDLPVDRREKKYNRKEIILNPNPINFESLTDVMKMSGIRKVPLARRHILDMLEQRDKVIVWFWFRDVGRELEKQLTERGITVAYVDGSVRDRQNQIDTFNHDDGEKPDCRVFLSQIAAAGVGVEIIGSSHNIFVEFPWSPGQLHQAMSRSWGPNQKDPHVSTDILTISYSIDSHVLHSQLRKQEDVIDVLIPIPPEKEMKKEDFNPVDGALRSLIEVAALSHKATVAMYVKTLFPRSFPRIQEESDMKQMAAVGTVQKEIDETTKEAIDFKPGGPVPAHLLQTEVKPTPGILERQRELIKQNTAALEGPSGPVQGQELSQVVPDPVVTPSVSQQPIPGLIDAPSPVPVPDQATPPIPGLIDALPAAALEGPSGPVQGNEVSLDEVRYALTEVHRQLDDGAPEVQKILQQHNANILSQLDAGTYASVVAVAEDVVAEFNRGAA